MGCYIDDAGFEVCDDNAWDDWVRWLVLGLVVGIALLIFVGFMLFACITARRRDRQGMKPFTGTGWTLGITPPGHNPPTYTPKDVELGPQPPAYNPEGRDEEGRGVRPEMEQGLVYPPPAQQPLPGGEHEVTQ